MQLPREMWHQLLPPELLINFWPGYVPNRLSAEASPQTPLGELKALPQTPSCIKGPTSKGGEGRGRGGEGKGREGIEREGRGGEGRQPQRLPQAAQMLAPPVHSEPLQQKFLTLFLLFYYHY